MSADFEKAIRFGATHVRVEYGDFRRPRRGAIAVGASVPPSRGHGRAAVRRPPSSPSPPARRLSGWKPRADRRGRASPPPEIRDKKQGHVTS